MSVTDEDVQAAIDSGEWVEKSDKKTGKTYFQNKKTKATCWDLKKELKKQKKASKEDDGGDDGEADKKEKKEKKEKRFKSKDKKKDKAEDEGDAGDAAEDDAKGKKKGKEKEKEKDKGKGKDKDKKDDGDGKKGGKEGKDAKSEKGDNDDTKSQKSGLGSRKGSAVSNVSGKKPASSVGSVVPYTPDILRSDDPTRGNLMARVTIDLGNGSMEGPETVYGWTEREVRLAASLRREQMRQRVYDRMSLREYLGTHDDAGSTVVAADYWDDDLGGGLLDGMLGPYRASLSPQSTRRGASPLLPTASYPRYRPYAVPPSNTSHLDELDAEGGREGALRAAAARGDIAAVMTLLRSGTARVDSPRQDGKTALHHAARHGHLEVIDTLLEAGADPTRRDHKGRTPLDLALHFGQRGAAARLQRRTPPSPRPGARSMASSPPRPPRPSPPPSYATPSGMRLSPEHPRYDAGLLYRPAGAPPHALSPGEARRQLSAEVTEAMSGVTSMVKGWIKEWAPPSGASPAATPVSARRGDMPGLAPRMQGPLPSRFPPTAPPPQQPPTATTGRISPPRPGRGGERLPPTNFMVDELTQHIWAAANGGGGGGPVPTTLSEPPSPPQPAYGGGGGGGYDPSPRLYGPPRPTTLQRFPPGSAYLLPTDSIDV